MSLIDAMIELRHTFALARVRKMPRITISFDKDEDALAVTTEISPSCHQGCGLWRIAGVDVTIEAPLPASPAALFEDEHRILGRIRELEAHRVGIVKRVYDLENAQAALEGRVLHIEIDRADKAP